MPELVSQSIGLTNYGVSLANDSFQLDGGFQGTSAGDRFRPSKRRMTLSGAIITHLGERELTAKLGRRRRLCKGKE